MDSQESILAVEGAKLLGSNGSGMASAYPRPALFEPRDRSEDLDTKTRKTGGWQPESFRVEDTGANVLPDLLCEGSGDPSQRPPGSGSAEGWLSLWKPSTAILILFE